MKAHEKLNPETIAKLESFARQKGLSVDAVVSHWIQTDEDTSSFHNQLLDAVGTSIIATDLDGTVIYANRFVELIYQWQPHEILGHNIIDFIPSNMTREQAQQIMEKLSKGESWSGEFEVQRKDGTTFIAYVTDHPITDREGKLIGIVGVSQDMTDQKLHEDNMRRNESRLQSFLESQSAFVVRIDREGKYTYANPAFLKTYIHDSRSMQSIIGQSCFNTIVPEDHDSVIKTADLCVKNPSKVFQNLMRNPSKTGEIGWTLWEFTGIPDQQGEVVEIQCIGIDITENKQNEALLFEHEHMKLKVQKEQERTELIQKLISMLSHDVKTFLTGILSSSDMVMQYSERLSTESRNQKLKVINDYTIKIRDLLDDTIDFARSNLQKRTLKVRYVDLVTLSTVAVEQVYNAYQTDHYIEVINHNVENPIVTDETLISRILINLLSNAVKYSPERTTIYLELERVNDNTIIKVKDNGIGISENDQKAIFDAFYRTEQVNHIEGTGLGLSIVKECVTQLKGTISVESGLNKGSTFIIELPSLNYQLEDHEVGILT